MKVYLQIVHKTKMLKVDPFCSNLKFKILENNERRICNCRNYKFFDPLCVTKVTTRFGQWL